MCKRLYPLSKQMFDEIILPLILSSYSRAGLLYKISDYQVFCAILYVLRTGIPWRDLPKCYGNWNHVYQRFKRREVFGVRYSIIYNNPIT